MRLPQFGLKTIFFVTFVAAIMALAVTRLIYLHHQIDHALSISNRFDGRGGGYTLTAWPWPKAVIELDFRGSPTLDDEALMILANLPIDEIDLSETRVTEHAVDAFRRARPSARIKR